MSGIAKGPSKPKSMIFSQSFLLNINKYNYHLQQKNLKYIDNFSGKYPKYTKQ